MQATGLGLSETVPTNTALLDAVMAACAPFALLTGGNSFVWCRQRDGARGAADWSNQEGQPE
jgi:hypothetical protein